MNHDEETYFCDELLTGKNPKGDAKLLADIVGYDGKSCPDCGGPVGDTFRCNACAAAARAEDLNRYGMNWRQNR